MPDLRPAWRFPLLVAGFLSLLTGVGAGLARLGWNVPDLAIQQAALHGPLMISGFFGTVITLERAVALAQRRYYLGPLAAGAGGLALLSPLPIGCGQTLLAVGSVVLLCGAIAVVLRQRAMFTATMALGAACWVLGNLLWISGASAFDAAPWWMGFLVLTIAGERLELSRFLPPSPAAEWIFALILTGLIAGMAFSPRLFGAGLLGLALWLLRQDIARRTVHDRGLTRYIAVCLLSGYAWLFLGGSVLLYAGMTPGSPAYDASLHALSLGFVFSMVFGHAPIIFPAVLRVVIPYHPAFYGPLLLLHLSLVLRLAGDGAGGPAWRAVGGMFNAAALAVFILTMAAAVIRGNRVRTP